MTVFAINETEFGWQEIVAAAQSWGEWQSFVIEVQQSLACLSHAAETNQPLATDEAKETATAFRYAHNLISADETQAWLNRWQMTVEDWMNCLRGKLLRDKWAGRLSQIVAAHPVRDEDLAQVLKHHAICADKLREWALKLAGHAAIAASSASFDVGSESPRDLISRIEIEFEKKRQQTITPKLVETKIADHRLDWIHVDCRCLWFAEEQIAREAAWCITEDGMTLDEVSRESRGEVQFWNFYLDEIDAAIRPYFLAARQGDWLGPLKYREGFPIFSILEKRMPSDGDPLIRQRAETFIIANLMEQEMNERVRWVSL